MKFALPFVGARLAARLVTLLQPSPPPPQHRTKFAERLSGDTWRFVVKGEFTAIGFFDARMRAGKIIAVPALSRDDWPRDPGYPNIERFLDIAPRIPGLMVEHPEVIGLMAHYRALIGYRAWQSLPEMPGASIRYTEGGGFTLRYGG